MGVFVTLALAAVAGHQAWNNRKGMSLHGVVQLSAEQATAFWWGMCLLMSLALALLVWVWVRSLRMPAYVELRPEGAFVPRGSLLGGMLLMPYSSIVGIQPIRVRDQQVTVVRAWEGESWLPQSAFSSPGESTAFVAALAERVRTAKSGKMV